MPDKNRSRWHGLWKRLRANGEPDAAFQKLTVGYSQPYRAYHNLNHITSCLDEFELVQSLTVNADAIEMAIWFHDVVYDSRAKDNEEQSAEMAKSVIQDAELPAAFGAQVRELIMATKHNALPKDLDTALLVDVDLSILGQSSEVFDTHEEQIRQEYSWVPKDAFAAGRSAILEAFLNRKEIYSTDFFRNKYEAAARRNLTHSIVRLRG